ncbi:MAG: hypothetical protein EBR27_11440 [Betaproteobacteria bacterium]|nr:hypothetical protein [Betaproteobacteria bacterium]
MIQIDTKFYVYRHINLDTNEIFYIGKGCGDRHYSRVGRNKLWYNYINKNTNWKSEIIYSELSEENAYDLEKSEIQKIGRKINGNGTLLNILPGGKGFPESYLVYREQLEIQMNLLPNDITKNKKRKLQRKELFDLVDKFTKIQNINNLNSKIDKILIEEGYKIKPKYDWEILNEEDRLNVILEEYNVFIHNLKINNKWANNLKTLQSISELDYNYIEKQYNLKENKYKSLYEKT